jgi:hypothetical protein
MDGWSGLRHPRDDEQETMNMKRSLFGFRPTRHLALGLGAAGLVLGASGASIAATALIQPAGALSVQVPAVAVREQNVNAAGRIRVALPKGGVGVNGSVSVSNLPVNSAGRLQTQNGSGEPHNKQFGGDVAVDQWVNLLSVKGSGVLTGVEFGNCDNQNGWQETLIINIDGQQVFNEQPGMQYWYRSTSVLSMGTGPTCGGWSLAYFPPGGLAFHNSLSVTLQTAGSSGHNQADVWYTTNS